MLLRRFLRNCDGGAAPFLALSLIPVMGLTGAAIDYSRASATRTALQAAVDATGLMLSKEAAVLSQDDLGSRVQAIFTAQFNRPEAYGVSISHSFSAPQQGSFALRLTAQAYVPARFASLIGTSELPVAATSEILWGIKRLNLALALDVTGSMASSGKMAALKLAAHNLLDTLEQAAKKPDDIKVSIVPFSTDVNVGTHNVNADWLDWDQWENANGTCSTSSYKTRSACVNAGRKWTVALRSTWNGCVWDRDQNFDIQTTPPAASQSTKFRTNQASHCPVAMQPLTADWAMLHAKVDEMAPTGNTNVTIGMAWAWQTLAPVAPLHAPEPDIDLDKGIILLTDGQNTQNRFSTSRSSIDSRTEKACSNAKAANIRIYTVRVVDGNANLLRNCATKPDMFYDVQDAVQLNSVFSSIAQNLANLRIAK